jgi:hypothetical protein
MAEMKIVARPWQPQDLLDDLQDLIDEESDNYLNTRRTTLCMARAYLEEHFAEQKWIPVTERLPNESDANARGYVLAIAKSDGCINAHAYHAVSRVPTAFTHWMPLPEQEK